MVLETSTRLLRLLSLLQARRDWPGPELAERLEVGVRTVRRDVERLRRLGYPVHATPGVAGGYRLGAGASLPPLLLDDEEAVAVAVGLRTAASVGVAGIEETSVRALAKLEQVLPAQVRRGVNAVGSVTVPYPGSGPTVDPEALAVIAAACRDHQRLRFAYRSHDGTSSRRNVEPHRLVHTGAGTWWPGTSTVATGGPSGWTGSRRSRRRTAGSSRASRRPRTSPHTSRAASPPRGTATRPV